jgi:thioredoxin 1
MCGNHYEEIMKIEVLIKAYEIGIRHHHSAAVSVFLAAVMLLLLVISCAELPSSNDPEIRKTLDAGIPAVINFGAGRCIPCRLMAPSLESLSTEYQGKVSILFVEAPKNISIAKEFNIRAMPTQIFFNAQGKEIKRHVGYMSKESIIRELKAMDIY